MLQFAVQVGIDQFGNPNLEEWRLGYALVPLYPKLRTSAEFLLRSLEETAPIVQALSSVQPQELQADIRFMKAGEYQGSLYCAGLDSTRVAAFQKRLSLSRYVGVTTWFRNCDPIMEFVYDTTDSARNGSALEDALLAVVVRDPAHSWQAPLLERLLRVPTC